MVTASLEPSFEDSALTRESLNALLENGDFQDFFMDEDKIEELLVTDQVLREQGQKILEVYLRKLKTTNTKATEEKPTSANQGDPQYNPQLIFSMLGKPLPSMDIAEKRDGQLEITTSEDDLQVLLTITQPYGGHAIEIEAIKHRIAQTGILAKPDFKAINTALESGFCDKLPIASGIKPKKGNNSQFEKLVSNLLTSGPKIDEKGIANYHDINKFVVVEAGDPLMLRHPPTGGENGQDVFGKVIPSEAGEALPFFDGIEGATTSNENADLLIASIKGHPILHERGVSVDAVLILKNASLATGNIDFDGSVCIEEDVADGITIKATGDVTVKGVVGKSTIDAGGDVSIAQGLIGGSKTGNTKTTDDRYGAFIDAKGSVTAKFASGAKVSAQNQISIAEYASHCDLIAGTEILMGQPVGKGSLIGGHAYAFETISVKTLGSTGGAPTEVRVGADADTTLDLRRVVQSLKKKQNQVVDNLESIRKLSIRAKVAGLSPQAKEIIENQREQLLLLDQDIVKLQAQEAEIKNLLMRTKKSRIVASHKIHQNVSVTILGSSHKVKEEITGGTFRFDARRVQFNR